MSGHYVDLLIIGFLYGILMCFIILAFWRKRKGPSSDDDDDGGISVPQNPILDLPPGVTLPTGPGVKVTDDMPEEMPV
ncbi:MAG: hypothetical protein NXI20_05400 [bacterium]|jgi:hypothetical protein|nr:hypothetical protein [bacterium]